jgi:acetoin utilization deacetylase AcuC-like enzyme
MSEAAGFGYLLDDCFLLHDTGARHPESPARLRAIRVALSTYEEPGRWSRVEPRPATHDELELVHRPGLIERVERAAHRAPTYLDPDTVVSEHSYQTALAAAGGVIECTEAILSGRLARAFAFVRPPGHHAERDRSMGFCLFNNVALAAAYARRAFGLDRIAVVDIDVHHGNGTQDIYYLDPHVLYVSTHQYPFYPGSGSFAEIGAEEGKGYTVNIPLPQGTGDEAFVPVYDRIVGPILEAYRPQLILVSAGFDAHFRDPLGGLRVTSRGYASAAAALIRASAASAGGRICFVLEGGYSPDGLQSCTRAVMDQIEQRAPAPAPASGVESPLYYEISDAARAAFGQIWKW